jgi:hypothetical protein
MRFNITLSLILGMIVGFSLSAQSIERQVIGSAGTVFNAGGYEMSFTVGETKVSSYNSGGHWLTEGFQQGELSVNTGIKDNAVYEELGVTVYPNPFTEHFTLELTDENIKDYDVAVYDMIGKVVNVDKMNKGNKVEVHLKGASTGIYFVRISKGNTRGRTIKLNKVLY